MEGAKHEKNHPTRTPPIHTSFKLHQNNVPQKITFFMKIYYCENRNTVQNEKLEKKINFTVFTHVPPSLQMTIQTKNTQSALMH